METRNQCRVRGGEEVRSQDTGECQADKNDCVNKCHMDDMLDEGITPDLDNKIGFMGLAGHQKGLSFSETSLSESITTLKRRTRFGCWARAMSGHAAAPPSMVIRSRRLMGLTGGQGSQPSIAALWMCQRRASHKNRRLTSDKTR